MVFLKLAEILKMFDYSLFTLKARNIPERCCPKCAAKLGVIFVTEHF
jgi:hypothetical protein